MKFTDEFEPLTRGYRRTKFSYTMKTSLHVVDGKEVASEASISGFVTDDGRWESTVRSVGPVGVGRPSGLDLFDNAVQFLKEQGIDVYEVRDFWPDDEDYNTNTKAFDAALKLRGVMDRESASEADLIFAASRTLAGRLYAAYGLYPYLVLILDGSIVSYYANPSRERIKSDPWYPRSISEIVQSFKEPGVIISSDVALSVRSLVHIINNSIEYDLESPGGNALFPATFQTHFEGAASRGPLDEAGDLRRDAAATPAATGFGRKVPNRTYKFPDQENGPEGYLGGIPESVGPNRNYSNFVSRVDNRELHAVYAVYEKLLRMDQANPHRLIEPDDILSANQMERTLFGDGAELPTDLQATTDIDNINSEWYYKAHAEDYKIVRDTDHRNVTPRDEIEARFGPEELLHYDIFSKEVSRLTHHLKTRFTKQTNVTLTRLRQERDDLLARRNALAKRIDEITRELENETADNYSDPYELKMFDLEVDDIITTAEQTTQELLAYKFNISEVLGLLNIAQAGSKLNYLEADGFDGAAPAEDKFVDELRKEGFARYKTTLFACLKKLQTYSSNRLYKNVEDMKENWFFILGVSPNASKAEIASAYRNKMMELHPERNHGASEERLAELTEHAKQLGIAYNHIKKQLESGYFE